MKAGINRELGVPERFCAGSMAGAISQTAIYPMEVDGLSNNITIAFIYMCISFKKCLLNALLQCNTL